MPKKIIVIGSGAAGMSAASSARKYDLEAKITVFTEDEYIAYSPCVIPWTIGGKVGWDNIIMHDPQYYKREKNIDVITKTLVTDVNDVDKTVTAGGKKYEYDSLVIATGGTIFIPPIDGRNLKNVFVVKTIKDGQSIQSALRESKTIVIIGAGIVGLETAAVLNEIGKKVVVVEMMDQIIPRIIDKDMADTVQKHLEEKGIKFIVRSPIQAINGNEKVESVTAANIDYPCDMVIFATGVCANLTIPKILKLDIGQLGAVEVSAAMQPYRDGKIVSDIFLAGDVVQCRSAVVSGPIMSQLGSTAVKQGMIAGSNAAGDKKIAGPVSSPWVGVIGDIHVAGTGLSLGLASWYGIKTLEGKATGFTRARYYPDRKPLTVKVSADVFSHKIVGAQIIAGEDATGRINWLASAIASGTIVEDFIYRSENAYCPPTSMVRDVVLMAVDDLRNKL
ncbi:MAG: FAD-dependent oxidoreductase [archaeon]|nr:FAD-dependent oxidoreductase [archaeon]